MDVSQESTVARLAKVLQSLSQEEDRELCAKIDSLIETYKSEPKSKAPSLLSLLTPELIAYVLSMLPAKEIVRSTCVSTFFVKSTNLPSVVEQALRLSAKERPLVFPDRRTIINQWAKDLDKVESLLVHGRLVPGRYKLHVTASPDITPDYSYDAAGELSLAPNQTCQGFASESSQTAAGVPSRIEGGAWTAQTMNYTYIYGTAPYFYSLQVRTIVESEDLTSGAAVIELWGTWRSQDQEAAADPRNRGVVNRMILRGPLQPEV